MVSMVWAVKLYLIGGEEGWFETPTNAVHSLRPSDKSLREEAALSICRSNYGVASSLMEILVCGGKGNGIKYLSSCEVFKSTQNR